MYPSFLRTSRGLATEHLAGSFWWLGLGLALLLAFAVWLLAARLQVIESSDRARIEYENPPFLIEAPAAGRVALSRLELHRKVAAGEVLLEIDSTVEQQRLDEVRVRKETLAVQLQAVTGELLARIGTQRAEAVEARAGHAVARVRAQGAGERAGLAADEAERYGRLRGQVAELEVLRIESLARQQRTDQAAAEREAERAHAHELLRRSYSRLHLAELRTEEARIKGDLAIAQASQATLAAELERRRVRAPYAGTIAAVRPVAVGSLVQVKESLATMLPEDPLRVVALFEPAAALGRVHPGQPAWLRLHGFPFTQYGRLPLRVHKRAGELHEGLVRVELSIVDGGAGFPVPLSHGLPGSADVAVESLSPFSLLLRVLGKLVTPVRLPSAPSSSAPSVSISPSSLGRP